MLGTSIPKASTTLKRLENEPENVSCRESGEESAKITFIVSQARCTRAGQTLNHFIIMGFVVKNLKMLLSLRELLWPKKQLDYRRDGRLSLER